MTTTPPEAPPGPRSAPEAGPDHGPRVTRDQALDVSRLRRTVGPQRRIAGVAGGLARQLDIDPIILRVALVVLVFFGGAGLVIYAACWALVPEDGRDRAPVPLDDRSRGVALVLVGLVSALALLGDSVGQWGVPWPLVGAAFVALVVLVVVERSRDDRPRITAPPVPHHVDPVTGQAVPHPPAPTTADALANLAPAPPRSSRRRGPILFWYTAAATLIVCGGLGVAAGAGLDLPATTYPAALLACCGAVLLVGSVWGRAGALIPLGLLAALALLVATIIGPWHGTGEQSSAPATAAGVLDSYTVTAGELDLDLTDVTDPQALSGRTVHLDVRFGKIVVTVPADLDVLARGRIRWAGQITMFDRLGGGSGGFSLSSRRDPGPSTATPLVLDATVGTGQVVVRTEGAVR